MFYPESVRKFFETGVLALSRSVYSKRQYFFVPPEHTASDNFFKTTPNISYAAISVKHHANSRDMYRAANKWYKVNADHRVTKPWEFAYDTWPNTNTRTAKAPELHQLNRFWNLTWLTFGVLSWIVHIVDLILQLIDTQLHHNCMSHFMY